MYGQVLLHSSVEVCRSELMGFDPYIGHSVATYGGIGHVDISQKLADYEIS